MEKWGLVLITFGSFLVMMSSASNPANLLMLVSGLFYMVLGVGLIIYKKKKTTKKVR